MFNGHLIPCYTFPRHLFKDSLRMVLPELAAPPLTYAVGFSMPCIPIQRTKASNQPVLVVSFGYIPKP